MNLFWWNVLDIARTSFKGIQNFKFQRFQNSLHPVHPFNIDFGMPVLCMERVIGR